MEVVKFFKVVDQLPNENEQVEVIADDEPGMTFDAIYSNGKFHVKGKRVVYKKMYCCVNCDPNPYGPRETIESFEKSYEPKDVYGFFRGV